MCLFPVLLAMAISPTSAADRNYATWTNNSAETLNVRVDYQYYSAYMTANWRWQSALGTTVLTVPPGGTVQYIESDYAWLPVDPVSGENTGGDVNYVMVRFEWVTVLGPVTPPVDEPPSSPPINVTISGNNQLTSS